MDRRGFLGALFSALVLDPDRALWVPGKKLISIPKPRPLELHEIALNVESLELALAQMQEWVMEGRHPIVIQPTRILVPPGERWWLKPQYRV